MKTKQAILFILFAIGQYYISAQDRIDSVTIDNVIIRSDKENFISNNNTNYQIDSTITKYYTQYSIADLLQYFTPALITQNGNAGVASINIRGTADDQTSIFWNGIKLNSLSLGSADISLIPINIAQQIEVTTNAASSAFGSGNFGAAILLNSPANFKKATEVSLRQTFASYKNFKTDFSFIKSTNRIYFSSSSSFQQAKNDFMFYDRYKINNPLVRQQNNKYRQWTTANDIHIKLKKQQLLSIGNFSYGKYYQIPSIMGSYELSNKFQEDFGTKSFINYSKLFKTSKLSSSTSHAYSFLLYNDSSTSLISKYRTNQLNQNINYFHTFNSYFSIDLGTDYTFNFANIDAYKQRIAQHRFAMYGGAKFSIQRFNLKASLRQEIINNQYIRPQFFVVADYSNKTKSIKTTLSYSDKFRYPDLNDLYWIPGGNKNLSPENGFTTEWQNDFILLKGKHQLQYVNTLYFMRINNNITWIPSTSGYYSPKNIKKTQHYGFENSLQYTINFNQKGLLKIATNYNYNHSSILEDESNASLKGNFIRYKPQHTFKNYIFYNYKYIDFGFNHLWISKRFTDDENLEVFALKPYSIIDTWLAVKFSKSNYNLSLVFKVNNLLNTSYESVKSYAQALRNYQLSIIFNFKTKQS